VNTEHGKQDIESLHEGDKIWAYNPETKKMEIQPVLAVWEHKDNDLVDVTISETSHDQEASNTQEKSETIHTTSKHPFLTSEQGFVPAGKLLVGMHVLHANGIAGVVTALNVFSGTEVMYNLTVSRDHTFTVGAGAWIVHNDCKSSKLKAALERAGRMGRPGQQAHHVIPCNEQNHALIAATAGRAGGEFDMNAAYNGRWLWNKANKANALRAGEPYHSKSNRYSARARQGMDELYNDLVSSGNLTPDTAFDALMTVTDGMNAWIDALGSIGTIFNDACGLNGYIDL
jgi:hypothetical protein